jgi:hypothetical protein
MKKVLYVIFVVTMFVSANVFADGMLKPATPSYTYQPQVAPGGFSGFNMSGFVDGSTLGHANADGPKGGDYETYSVGTAKSSLIEESKDTVFGQDTNCGPACEDRVARIKSNFEGHHESGVFASNSGNEPSELMASTNSRVEFEGETAIQDWGNHGHDGHDWGDIDHH